MFFNEEDTSPRMSLYHLLCWSVPIPIVLACLYLGLFGNGGATWCVFISFVYFCLLLFLFIYIIYFYFYYYEKSEPVYDVLLTLKKSVNSKLILHN
jgi:hypothetical protein